MQNIAGYAASLCIPKYYHQPPSSRGEPGGRVHNQGMVGGGGGTKQQTHFWTSSEDFFYIYSNKELARNVILKKE